jgi:hypothetical protein
MEAELTAVVAEVLPAEAVAAVEAIHSAEAADHPAMEDPVGNYVITAASRIFSS